MFYILELVVRLVHKYGLSEKNVRCLHAPIYTFMRATVTPNTIVTICNNHISLKNDRSVKEARALVVDMCAGQMRWPKIPHSTIYY